MKTDITQAVILCAGLGTRLREIAKDVPKPMVPLLGKPLLQWHIEELRKHGVQDVFINLHHLPEVIVDHFGDGERFGVRISYVHEPELRGTAGGIKNFEGQLHGDFFVVYGDIFSQLNYSAMAAALTLHPDALGIEAIGATSHPLDSDLVEVDEQLRFLKIHRKPHTTLPQHYKGMKAIFAFRERVLSFIPAGRYYEIDHQLLVDALTNGEHIQGYDTTDFLRDVGTPDRYREVERVLLSQAETRPA